MPKSGLSKARDDYAAFRCACKHLCYADWEPGDPCQFCSCVEHEPKAGGGER